MVPKCEPRGRSRVPLSGALLCAALTLSCSRKAEIENAPDGGTLPVTELPRPEGGVPIVEDADLANPDGLECNQRPRQAACAGANDFGCDFDGWLQTLAEVCQVSTDCHTDGWVEVLLGAEGCATELRMEDPDAAYVACLSEQLSQYQCPCRDVVGSRFLGLDHDGCTNLQCGTGEVRCAPGSSCHEGQCVADDALAAGAPNE